MESIANADAHEIIPTKMENNARQDAMKKREIHYANYAQYKINTPTQMVKEVCITMCKYGLCSSENCNSTPSTMTNPQNIRIQ